jgi:hypothetical protein
MKKVYVIKFSKLSFENCLYFNAKNHSNPFLPRVKPKKLFIFWLHKEFVDSNPTSFITNSVYFPILKLLW